MKLTLESISKSAADWTSAGVKLPSYDVAAVRAATEAAPEWVHFGAGNIFRGFIGSLNQRLLDAGLAKTGIIACDTFDFDVIDKIYDAFDSLTLNVTLNPDGTTSREVLAGVAKGVKADFTNAAAADYLRNVFRTPSLKMLSFTITEKGYQLRRTDGSLMPVVQDDLDSGPSTPKHAMSIVAALLLERFNAGELPMSVVSMDNCSHNGEKLMNAVLEIARGWIARGFASADFLGYLTDETKIAFPWSMIDKITPRPHPMVQESLEKDGFEDMAPVVTSKKTFIAPFVNAEKPQYLVIEDKFPNGRPPLEKAGVYFTDRDTVNMTEKMKVTTCLNPLHTAMSMYGCLLGYTLICKEMQDADIVKLVTRLGYVEGLPVVVDPKVLSPKAFIDEVVKERLPNPFMPDDPRRIATDTSQKVGIRFGETIKSYVKEGRDLNSLVALPLAIAGWMRYLLAVDDAGEAMEVSPDPLKDELQGKLAGIAWNDAATYRGQLRPILANATIFGSDLTATPLADRIEGYFRRLLEGPGSARRLLREALVTARAPSAPSRPPSGVAAGAGKRQDAPGKEESMNRLSYPELERQGYAGYLLKDAPERVLQFGEGNFLRAFVDYFFDRLNEEAGFNGKVCLVQPIAGGDFVRNAINEQDGLYTLYLRGFQDGRKVNAKRVISSVSRCINPYTDFAAFLKNAENPDLRFLASNTTEAGIAYDPACKCDDQPPASFPAKLTRFLHERFVKFNGAADKGFIILSCELIDHNGRELKKIVLKYAADWNLGADFTAWVEKDNTFCSTLVDRIVTGYPKEADAINRANGYVDNVIDTGECFGLWVIEGPQSIRRELGLDKVDLPILVVDDHTPYKQRKVRILNGAHTSFVLGAYLKGFDIVRDCMNDDGVRGFMEETIYDEIIPTLSLPEQELKDFAHAVTERFKNPFIDHRLLDISLNSVSKWKARCLPSVKAYAAKFGKRPKNLVSSFRSLVEFYGRGEKWNADGNALEAKRGADTYLVRDDKKVLAWFLENRGKTLDELVKAAAANTDFWGEDITSFVC